MKESQISITKLKSNVKWVSVSNALSLCIGLLLTFIAAAYLGKERFGQLEYIISISTFLLPMSALGLNSIVAKELVKYPKDEDEILYTTALIRLVSAILACGITILWLVLFTELATDFKVAGCLVSSIIIFNSLGWTKSYFEAENDTKKLAIVKLLRGAVDLTVRGSLILLSSTLIAFLFVPLLLQVVESLSQLKIFYKVRKKKISKKYSWIRGKKLLKRSWPLILSGLFSVIYLKIDKIMLGSYGYDTELGIYGVSSRISEGYIFIPMAIVGSIMPLLIYCKGKDREKYEHMMQGGYDFMYMVALLISSVILIVVYLCSPIFSRFGYSEVFPILCIHMGGTVFLSMRALLSKWLIIENQTIHSVTTHGIGAFINIVLNMLLIPELRSYGAAWSTLISYAFASWLSLLIFKQTRSQFKMMGKALLTPVRPKRCLILVKLLKENKF